MDTIQKVDDQVRGTERVWRRIRRHQFSLGRHELLAFRGKRVKLTRKCIPDRFRSFIRDFCQAELEIFSEVIAHRHADVLELADFGSIESTLYDLGLPQEMLNLSLRQDLSYQN